MALIVLPPKYYLSHFFEFLDFVEHHYKNILAPEHSAFITAMRQLSENAQCTFIRMVNRKGLIFDRKGFQKYAEIENLSTALFELESKNFVEPISQKNNLHLLTFLPKAKLRKWLNGSGMDALVSLSRDEMVELGFKNRDRLDFKKVESLDQLMVQGYSETMQYLLFLYFGRIQKSLTLYTLRDLGIRQSNTLKTDFKPRFTSAEQAQAEYFFAQHLNASLENLLASELNELFDEGRRFQNLSSSTQHLKDALYFSIAEFTLDVDDQMALAALDESLHPDARQKKVRQLYKIGRKDDCIPLLDEMQTNPRSDEELLFAEDFSDRKFNKKKIGRLTEVLQNCRELIISDFYLKRPELGVSAYFQNQGIQAVFSENAFWASLFGVLFWESLFESETAAIHNPFERSPSDLVGPEFYYRNKVFVESQLALLKDVNQFSEKILKTIAQNYGRLNDIFLWNNSLGETLIEFVKNTQAQDVAHVLRSLAKNYDSVHVGFPDLMIEEHGKVRFIEVKAEGDSLRANQLARLQLLKESGFEVEVLRVRWETDPNQPYVVVDVETTGATSSYHRVTEIGAVKVQNGKIIDEFQTLINPGRSIPSFITGITGITNAMVADAPKFSDIAEKFYDFLEGSIFVAHNVNFDYKFIQSEFAKAGIDFVRPLLCTCAGMRKTHPGLKSYGLKNLTQHFEIKLEQHHRALSDARAAAELLLLMNQKRSTALSEESRAEQR